MIIFGYYTDKTEFFYRCKKCNKEYNEKELEVSHNIPKYMGGTDKEGRTWLCKNHHKQYERMILSVCFIRIFKQFISYSEDNKTLTLYMNKIKNSPEEIKNECRKIAMECHKEFYLKEDKENDTNTRAT